MISSRPIYIVRQHAVVSVAFLAAGLLFCVFPWFVELDAPLWARLVWTGIGIVAFTVVRSETNWESTRRRGRGPHHDLNVAGEWRS